MVVVMVLVEDILHSSSPDIQVVEEGEGGTGTLVVEVAKGNQVGDREVGALNCMNPVSMKGKKTKINNGRK